MRHPLVRPPEGRRCGLTTAGRTVKVARVRVVIADDSLLVREGIASLLRRAGFDVVAEASTGDEAVELVDAHAPDIAIVDIRMPPTHTDEGLRAAARDPRAASADRRS